MLEKSISNKKKTEIPTSTITVCLSPTPQLPSKMQFAEAVTAFHPFPPYFFLCLVVLKLTTTLCVCEWHFRNSSNAICDEEFLIAETTLILAADAAHIQI